ncbi:hypothetical protein D3C76_1351900 [compost metagenome]
MCCIVSRPVFLFKRAGGLQQNTQGSGDILIIVAPVLDFIQAVILQTVQLFGHDGCGDNFRRTLRGCGVHSDAVNFNTGQILVGFRLNYFAPGFCLIKLQQCGGIGSQVPAQNISRMRVTGRSGIAQFCLTGEGGVHAAEVTDKANSCGWSKIQYTEHIGGSLIDA